MAFLKTIPIIALISTAPIAIAQTTFYVNGSCGDDDWTGTSSVCEAPNGPKRTIQAGIDATSVDGDTVIVADGTYTGVGNKNLDFGFRNITLRSQNGPATCIIDCEGDGRGFYFQNGETADAVLEGLTIRNGFADYGGGVRCDSSSPTVTDCTFSGNTASRGGGGGGMYNHDSSPTVTDCTFSGNTGSGGGGMYNVGGDPMVTDCTFSGNTANFPSRGGGMRNSDSDPIVTNCTFSKNSASRGGGIYNTDGSNPTMTNCTFSGNSASYGGGIYNFDSDPIVTNCILWNNSPNEIVNSSGAITTVRFSDVQGGWPGTSNIDLDPLFVDPANADYRLAPSSPCIDAADNTAVPPGVTTDLDGNPRFVDDPATPDCQWFPGTCGDPPIVDMGAYEFQACDPCDMNCDGDVNAFDIEPFLDLLFGPGEPCAPCTGDVNGDGRIDAFDIEPFLECLFP